jgi:hypothetical protein
LLQNCQGQDKCPPTHNPALPDTLDNSSATHTKRLIGGEGDIVKV